MPPRATVQQAIELLKIHQIRRENAAIYQQIQIFRDEMTDLKDTHDVLHTSLDNTQAEIQIIQNSASKTTQRLNQADTTLRKLVQDRNTFQAKFEDIRTLQNETSKTFEEKCNQLSSKITGIESGVRESRDESILQYKEWTGKLGQMQEQLMKTTAGLHVEAAHDQLSSRQHSIPAMKGKNLNYDSISCVHDSVEEQDADNLLSKLTTLTAIPSGFSILTDRAYHSIDLSIPLVSGVEPNSAIEDAIPNLLRISQSENQVRESTMPDDVDLDEAANEISYAGHGQALVICPDSFVMLPYQTIEPLKSVGVDEVPSLHQDPHETLVQYFRRGQELLKQFPAYSESYITHSWVEGLADKKDRQNFIKWLTSTPWIHRNLLNLAQLPNINSLEFSTSHRDVPTCSPEPAIPSGSPTILVPATDVDSNNSTLRPKSNSKASPSSSKPQPRRSQRIAAKLQQNTQTQMTESLETESQAQRFDTLIAEATKKRERKGEERKHLVTTISLRESTVVQTQEPETQSVVVQSKKRKPVEKKTGAMQEATEDHRKRSRHTTSKKNTQKAVKQVSTLTSRAQNKDDTDTASTLRNPRTPSKQTTRDAYTTTLLKGPAWPSSSPLHGKQHKTQVSKLNLKGPKAVVPVPSPYDPKPRLVSREREAAARTNELLSDSDVFLPRLGRTEMQSTEGLVVSKQQDLPKLVKRKRRLPLPPPPEIPILSTSSEGHRRFDRW